MELDEGLAPICWVVHLVTARVVLATSCIRALAEHHSRVRGAVIVVIEEPHDYKEDDGLPTVTEVCHRLLLLTVLAS